MAERRAHPVAGWAIFAAVVLSAAAGGVAVAWIAGGRSLSSEPTPGWWWVAAGVGGALLLVLGASSAWWVGTGRGGRPGRLATAALVGLLTVAATSLLVFGATTRWLLALPAVVVFLLGLCLTWRFGSGRWRLRRKPDAEGVDDG